MKRLIIFSLCQLLIFISPFSSVLAQETKPDSVRIERTYADGLNDGTQFAHNNYHSGNWFWAGFAGGLLLYGPIGTGVIAGVSQLGTPRPPLVEQFRVQKESPPYQEGFQQGYAHRAKAKALGKSLLGGAVGTVVLATAVALFIATMSSSDGNIGGGSWD